MKLRKLPDNVHSPLLYPAYGSTAGRAPTHIAKRDAGDANANAWSITLQGANETVFFDAC